VSSPFSFGRAIGPEAFTNREEEIRRLSANFENGVNTTIISPRRWGKSSLVKRVASQLAGRKIRVATIDMFSMRSEEELYSALASAVLKAASSKSTEWLSLAGRFLKRITPKFTVELGDKQNFGLSLDLDAAGRHYRELLDLPQQIARDRKIRIVICIDEFQNIGTFHNPLQVQKRLRSAWQHHDLVTYCLYGSRQHMMTELFTRQSNPFYRFGELMLLRKIAEPKWVSYITRQFQKTGKKISAELAREIALAVDCHPFYVQQLAHITWQMTEKESSRGHLDEAVAAMLQQNSILYYREAEDLNNTELRLLRAISSGETQLSAAATIQKYRLGTSAGVVKAKRSLAKKELVDEDEGVCRFLDPAFALWFSRHMM
jgi:uncharacterized protein